VVEEIGPTTTRDTYVPTILEPSDTQEKQPWEQIDGG
jgi:hypothetical protein